MEKGNAAGKALKPDPPKITYFESWKQNEALKELNSIIKSQNKIQWSIVWQNFPFVNIFDLIFCILIDYSYFTFWILI